MLTIGFVGGLRYVEINRNIVDSLANSSEYALLYVGKKHPGFDLETYCELNGILNVRFLSAYRNEEKENIYKYIQIINCVYGNKSPEVRTALPNKLYDAALYKKPIIVSKGTYLHRLVAEYDLGLAIDLANEIKTELDKYLCCFDKDVFLKGCERFLQVVSEEKRLALGYIDEFVSTMKYGGK